jgi:hypothetical protein
MKFEYSAPQGLFYLAVINFNKYLPSSSSFFKSKHKREEKERRIASESLTGQKNRRRSDPPDLVPVRPPPLQVCNHHLASYSARPPSSLLPLARGASRHHREKQAPTVSPRIPPWRPVISGSGGGDGIVVADLRVLRSVRAGPGDPVPGWHQGFPWC